ncbi:hypothetical protein [Butyrivibrio sp. WCE2006]|uniref:hypothetical protein n=1 Tax=Butyrivibrio sp. WCE2006 TaxID=1410611 RepID=UPI0005D1FD60|nr:hypothetical protein [Butyrivibrio sp. WCE2006]
MNIEDLLGILNECANQNSEVDSWLLFDKRWDADKKLVEYFDKHKLSTEGLLCVVSGKDPVLFYDSFCLYNSVKVEYDSVLLCGSVWDYRINSTDNKHFYIITKNQTHRGETNNDNVRYLKTVLQRIVEKRIENYYASGIEYYDDLYTQVLRVDDFWGRTLCVDLAKEVSEKYRSIFAALKIMSAAYALNKKKPGLLVKIEQAAENIAVLQKLRLDSNATACEKMDDYLQEGQDKNYYMAFVVHCLSWIDYFNEAEKYNLDKNHKEKMEVSEFQKNKFRKVYKKLYDGLLKNVEYLSLPDFVENYQRIQPIIKRYSIYSSTYMCVEMCYFFTKNQFFKDAIEARKWFSLVQDSDERFRNSHYGEVAFNISVLYRDGLGGVNKSENEQEKYLKESASMDFAKAYGELSRLYHRNGNEDEARKFSKLAIEKGVGKEGVYRPKKDWDAIYVGANKILDVTGRGVSQVVEAVGSAGKAGADVVGAVFDGLSRYMDSKKEKVQNEADINRIHREEELDKLKHEQDVGGQKAVNERQRKRGYKDAKRKK